MSDNQNQPREFDAVLGGQALPPPSLVLGGLEGVKRRLTSSVIEVQVAALSDALSYGEAGLELVIQALPNSSEQLQRFASLLLREKGGDIGKQALLDYDPWLFFTTLQDWTKDELYSRVSESVGTTYAVKTTKQLQNFVRNSQVKNLEALVCEIEDNRYNFQDFVNILAEAHEDLPNLKALFIGDSKDSEQWIQGCSQIYLRNIYPILKAFPYLEVLHLCGRIGQPDNPLLKDIHKEVLLQIRNPDGSVIERKKLKPTNLKTLIVEGADLKDNHLTQICEIEYPSLEYLELWLGRQDTEKVVDSLTPILSGKSCPNLLYLGLIGSENTNAIARVVTQSPIIERLKVLDLADGTLSNAGTIALLQCPAINRLDTLNVSKNRLTTNMIERLSQLNCQVITDSQFDHPYRYYSVWE